MASSVRIVLRCVCVCACVCACVCIHIAVYIYLLLGASVPSMYMFSSRLESVHVKQLCNPTTGAVHGVERDPVCDNTPHHFLTHTRSCLLFIFLPCVCLLFKLFIYPPVSPSRWPLLRQQSNQPIGSLHQAELVTALELLLMLIFKC